MQIEKTTPSQVLKRIDKDDTSYTELISEGYQLSEGARQILQRTIRSEYEYPNDRTDVYLASDETGKVIGSLTVVNYNPSDLDPFGRRFFGELFRQDASIYKKFVSSRLPLSFIAGIVVHPQFRRQRLAHSLFMKAIESRETAVLAGQTRTPEVLLLSQLVPGYRFFFGDSEITPNKFSTETKVHLPIYNALRQAAQIRESHPEGLVHIVEDHLSSAIPKVNHLPEEIQTVFQPLIAAQERIGDEHVVMSFLLMVKEGLLEDISS